MVINCSNGNKIIIDDNLTFSNFDRETLIDVFSDAVENEFIVESLVDFDDANLIFKGWYDTTQLKPAYLYDPVTLHDVTESVDMAKLLTYLFADDNESDEVAFKNAIKQLDYEKAKQLFDNL